MSTQGAEARVTACMGMPTTTDGRGSVLFRAATTSSSSEGCTETAFAATPDADMQLSHFYFVVFSRLKFHKDSLCIGLNFYLKARKADHPLKKKVFKWTWHEKFLLKYFANQFLSYLLIVPQ